MFHNGAFRDRAVRIQKEIENTEINKEKRLKTSDRGKLYLQIVCYVEMKKGTLDDKFIYREHMV